MAISRVCTPIVAVMIAMKANRSTLTACGMARRRGLNFAAQDGSRVRAVAARNPETGPALAGELGVALAPSVEALLARPDVDAVVIATSNDSHGDLAQAALAAGKAVFLEYPLARHEEQVEPLVRTAREHGTVLRLAHGEVVDAEHQALKARVAQLGDLLTYVFVRLTPGRGARPEVLLNLPVSGPPALFFVYHVYPVVDLFGPADWVEASCRYEGLDPATGRYRRFHNQMTAGLAGGTATWSWSGGIEVDAAEQFERLVLTGGTLSYGDGWSVATSAGREDLVVPKTPMPTSLEALFLSEVRNECMKWQDDLLTAAAATRLCLGAERSMAAGGRVALG